MEQTPLHSASRPDPLVGKQVIILNKSDRYKGWRGEVREVGLKCIVVAVGHRSTMVSLQRSDLALL